MNKLELERLEKESRNKHFSRGKVAKAVKEGWLIKEPCFCGETKVEAHHPDYTKPLEVIWACKKHHVKLDKMRREEELFRETGIVIDSVVPNLQETVRA